MKIRNLPGPSGIPLGGTGVGYFEISPEGKLTRNCIGNIHRSVIDSPKGFFCAVYDGRNAVRLQRDDNTEYGMTAYDNSDVQISGERSICFSFHPVSEFLMNYTDFTIEVCG